MKIYEWVKFVVFISCLFVTESNASANEELIVVNKNNVEYKFVRFDEKTDHFTQNIFWNWKNETFEVFEQVRNKESIAIDLGAWIGTTSIWLSKNFHNVVAVEPDVKSLECLQKNLEASDCSNVLICDKPVSRTNKKIISGPEGATCNESISHEKSEVNNENDYAVQAITFKQLVYDYVYANDNINNCKISFIKCDIEGGEEDILEDVLHFAYNNDCTVYMSFHLDCWKNKNISDYEYLFSYFKTNCPIENISEYLLANPSASLLFQPLHGKGVLVKKNIPVFVICYNQITFIRNMVKQLEKYTSDINLIDNNSNYQPLLDYYKNDYHYTLLKQKTNHGFKVYMHPFIQKLTGNLYVLTDPDLQFNPKLPDSFMEDLIGISNYYGAHKVGFALLIDSDDIRTDVMINGESIQSWESRFWINRLDYPLKPHMEMYSAAIDTTFCLINRRFGNPAIRVAGDFTCKHIPWHKNFRDMLEEGEADSYLRNNNSTNWFK